MVIWGFQYGEKFESMSVAPFCAGNKIVSFFDFRGAGFAYNSPFAVWCSVSLVLDRQHLSRKHD